MDLSQELLSNSLKFTAIEIFNLEYAQPHGGLIEEVDLRYDKTPRQILQEFGVAVRKIHPETWSSYAQANDRLYRKEEDYSHSN